MSDASVERNTSGLALRGAGSDGGFGTNLNFLGPVTTNQVVESVVRQISLHRRRVRGQLRGRPSASKMNSRPLATFGLANENVSVVLSIVPSISRVPREICET